MEVDDESSTSANIQNTRQIIGMRLNKTPKTSAERGQEFRARKRLHKEQQQKPDLIDEALTEENQCADLSKIKISDKRTSAERTRRWREKKRGVSGLLKKQRKTAAERMREYRERKKEKRNINIESKNDGNGGDHILSRKRKGAEDVNSIKSEQKLRKSNRINNRIAPIEEIMIKVEPSDEPVEEVFINPEQIKEPGMEIAVKEEPIGESVEEIVIKEEHIDDYPVYSQVYKHIQLQIKSEEDDEEKYQIPGQSS